MYHTKIETYWVGYQHADGWIGGGTMANDIGHARRMLLEVHHPPSTAIARVIYTLGGKARKAIVESLPLVNPDIALAVEAFQRKAPAANAALTSKLVDLDQRRRHLGASPRPVPARAPAQEGGERE